MKLKETIFLSLAVVAFIIGTHRAITEGIALNYWLFMLAIIFLMLFRHENHKRKEAEQPQQNEGKSRKKARTGRK